LALNFATGGQAAADGSFTCVILPITVIFTVIGAKCNPVAQQKEQAFAT
jgi:hypothetical protein